jgi:hypothetical protein
MQNLPESYLNLKQPGRKWKYSFYVFQRRFRRAAQKKKADPPQAGNLPFKMGLEPTNRTLQQVGDGLFFREQFLFGSGHHFSGKIADF